MVEGNHDQGGLCVCACVRGMRIENLNSAQNGNLVRIRKHSTKLCVCITARNHFAGSGSASASPRVIRTVSYSPLVLWVGVADGPAFESQITRASAAQEKRKQILHLNRFATGGNAAQQKMTGVNWR